MIKLTMTEEQAKIVSLACEFYARVRMGQFNEIVWHLLDIKIPSGEYCERREKAEQLLLDVRKQLYPDLHGAGHSYGIGKFDDADLAFDVHQVIRHEMGDGRTPSSYHDLPICERVELSSIATDKRCDNCLHGIPLGPAELYKRALAQMWFAYVNKDGEYPHDYELEALQRAEELLGPWEECMPELLKDGKDHE